MNRALVELAMSDEYLEWALTNGDTIAEIVRKAMATRSQDEEARLAKRLASKRYREKRKLQHVILEQGIAAAKRLGI